MFKKNLSIMTFDNNDQAPLSSNDAVDQLFGYELMSDKNEDNMNECRRLCEDQNRV